MTKIVIEIANFQHAHASIADIVELEGALRA